MTDEPRRRPILKLKNPPKVVVPGRPAPAAAPPVQHDWKCKPCGAGLSVPVETEDAAEIRCPACNAKLGTAADFRADPPPAKLRARSAKR